MPPRPRGSIASTYFGNTVGFTIACVPLALTWALLFDLETEWFQARLDGYWASLVWVFLALQLWLAIDCVRRAPDVPGLPAVFAVMNVIYWVAAFGALVLVDVYWNPPTPTPWLPLGAKLLMWVVYLVALRWVGLRVARIGVVPSDVRA